MPPLRNHLMDSCSYVRKNTLRAAKGGCICTPLTPAKSTTGDYPLLPYPSWQLHQMKALVRLDQVVIQHTHNEWSGVTNPGLLTIASQQEDVQAEMLPYTKATNPYYFPVVIVPVFVLCL